MTDKQTAVPVGVVYQSSDNLPGTVRDVRLTVPGTEQPRLDIRVRALEVRLDNITNALRRTTANVDGAIAEVRKLIALLDEGEEWKNG